MYVISRKKTVKYSTAEFGNLFSI